MIEYRIGWSTRFQGCEDEGEWTVWDGDANATADEVRDELTESTGQVSRALEEAIESASFDFWVQVRTV